MKTHPTRRLLLVLPVTLLLGACVQPDQVRPDQQPGAMPPVSRQDAGGTLLDAQAAGRAGKAAEALRQYRRIGQTDGPQQASAALMGRFMLRIDPQSGVGDMTQARTLAAELDALAKQSKDPVATEFAEVADAHLKLQDSIQALAKQANEAHAVKARLQATEAELKQRDQAIAKLRRALTN